MSMFNQPNEHDEITCKGCGATIEYDFSFREGWLEIRDEDTPEMRFYCRDCKREADISGDPSMGRFQAACKALIPHLEEWAEEYLAVADDYGDWMDERGVDTNAISLLWDSVSIASDLSAALYQVAELDLEDD